MAEPTGLEPATSDVTVQSSLLQNGPKLLKKKILGSFGQKMKRKFPLR
jgi:hypothetical protein